MNFSWNLTFLRTSKRVWFFEERSFIYLGLILTLGLVHDYMFICVLQWISMLIYVGIAE